MTSPSSDSLLHVEQSPQRSVGSLASIPCSAILPNPNQPRSNFDEEELAALRESIRKHGLLQPIVVRPSESETQYVLVAGERRLRAAIEAGYASIPALIRTMDETDGWINALVENIDRVDLNPIEEGEAYLAIMTALNLTQERLAERLGVTRARISQVVLLPGLPESVRRRVAAGVLTFGHARVLCSLRDPGQQEFTAKRIVAEGMTVRQTEEYVLAGNVPGYETVTKRPRTRRPPTMLTEVSRSLMDQLDTKVTVRAATGKGRGRIVIDFADDADLERILAALLP